MFIAMQLFINTNFSGSCYTLFKKTVYNIVVLDDIMHGWNMSLMIQTLVIRIFLYKKKKKKISFDKKIPPFTFPSLFHSKQNKNASL